MTEKQPQQNQPGDDVQAGGSASHSTPSTGSTPSGQPQQGAMPSFGSTPRDGATQPLPSTGSGQPSFGGSYGDGSYGSGQFGSGQHAQHQYAPPQGGFGQGAHSQGAQQYGNAGAYQGTSPGQPYWSPQGQVGQPGHAGESGQPPVAPPPQNKAKRRGLALVATTALLVGTAGGVAGAAVYSATTDSTGASPSVTSPLTGGQAAPIAAPDGSIQKAAAQVLPSVVKIGVMTPQGAGTGSGIVISKDGLIVTNNHVVAGAAEGGKIAVMLNDGRTVAATIVGTDPLTDLAVIRASAKDLTPAVLGSSDKLQVGQEVVAIGSPFGLEATVTSGIVSALGRPVTSGDGGDSNTVFPAVQTDAAINPGNSGGALIDLAGQVVGINSAIKTAGGSGQSAGGNIGLGFAIPIDQAKPIIDELVAKGKATHARLGVTVGDAESTDGLQQGAKIGEVTPGGAADKAGLKEGDVVTAVNGKAVASGDALVAAVRSHRPDEEVTITYNRGSATGQTAKAKLGSDGGKPTG